MRTLLVRARLVWLQQVTRPMVYRRGQIREVERSGAPSTWAVRTGHPFPWSITHTASVDDAMGLRAPALRELSRLARVERALIEQLPRRSPW